MIESTQQPARGRLGALSSAGSIDVEHLVDPLKASDHGSPLSALGGRHFGHPGVEARRAGTAAALLGLKLDTTASATIVCPGPAAPVVDVQRDPGPW